MIYYWLHLLYIYLGAKFFWKKVALEDDLSRMRRVSLLDCESMRFMANSKYLFYMDFIRFEILFRTKLYDHTFKKGIFAVLGSQKIIYKKPLKRWNKFKLTLVLDGWDDKWVYHRQIFTREGEIYAVGFTKVTFWKDKKAQDIREIIANTGTSVKDMPPSEEMLGMFDSDYEILKNTKEIDSEK